MTSDRHRGPRARRFSACAADDCLKQIFPGHAITRRPEGGWKHRDCANPGRRQRGKDNDE